MHSMCKYSATRKVKQQKLYLKTVLIFPFFPNRFKESARISSLRIFVAIRAALTKRVKTDRLLSIALHYIFFILIFVLFLSYTNKLSVFI